MSHRPTMEHTLMAIASVMSKRSTCSRNQVGCVVALEGRILATGYNGAPAGMQHCDHTCTCSKGDHVLDINQHSLKCAKGTCLLSVHAEANAVAFAARNGIPLKGSSLYTTLSPCVPCAQLIINAGIIEVTFDVLYRITDGIELLTEAGVRVQQRGS